MWLFTEKNALGERIINHLELFNVKRTHIDIAACIEKRKKLLTSKEATPESLIAHHTKNVVCDAVSKLSPAQKSTLMLMDMQAEVPMALKLIQWRGFDLDEGDEALFLNLLTQTHFTVNLKSLDKNHPFFALLPDNQAQRLSLLALGKTP